MSNEFINPQIGYVIEIPSNESVIINIGSEDGYEIGDKFIIYEEGPKVIDSKTEKTLGIKTFTKEVVEIVDIYPLFSECQKIIRSRKDIPTSVSMMVQGKTYKETEKLAVEYSQIKNWKIKNINIQINDPIKEA